MIYERAKRHVLTCITLLMSLLIQLVLFNNDLVYLWHLTCVFLYCNFRLGRPEKNKSPQNENITN